MRGTLHHVTYHVEEGKLQGAPLKLFMSALGFQEVPVPEWELEAAGDRLNVRWFQSGRQQVLLHMVESDDGERDSLALGHFCVQVGRTRFEGLKKASWCVRNSGNHGRIWCEFANLRVEVRP